MNPTILIIDDERGKRYFIRPMEEPPPVKRRVIVLTARVACVHCGEYGKHSPECHQASKG